MTYPIPDPPQLPPGSPRCPQCGETEECAGDQRWQHERDYRSSEPVWWRQSAIGPSVVWRDGRVEVTR